MNNRIDISEFVSIVSEQSIKKELVERFKKRRKEFGLTQKELSTKSGVSYGSIRRFELSGEISLHALLRISSVIGCLEDFNAIFKNRVVRDIRR